METIKLPLVVAVLAVFVAFAAAATPLEPRLTADKTTVDEGESFVLTCTKLHSDVIATYEYYFFDSSDSRITNGQSGNLLKTTTTASQIYTCKGYDTATKTLGTVSKEKSVTMTALRAPTISSACAPATGNKLSVVSGTNAVFICAKDAANNAPKEYKFMVGNTAVTSGVTGAVYTRTVIKADDQEKVKCTFFNTNDAKKFSANEITLTVTGSCSEFHVVSLTTTGLFLVLGAIFRE